MTSAQTAEEWHADIQISLEIAKQCIDDQFPLLSPIKKISCLGEGWDNKAFLVNDEILFRFPRREIAVQLISRETAVLKSIKNYFDVAIPCPIYNGTPSVKYPYEFHGYKLIVGASAIHANLSEKMRLESLPILAKFLKKLHGITKKQASAVGAESQVFNRLRLTEMVETLKLRVAKIIANKFCVINLACFEEEMKDIQKIKLPEKDYCLVHGDLDARHLIFSNEKLTGVIDWGDTGINHPVVDLGILWSFYPAKAHVEFFDLYGEVDKNTWAYARFLGLYSALTLLLYGFSIQDSAMQADAVNAVSKINPVLIGNA